MHTLTPPDEMVVEAIEAIDQVLTEHAMKKVRRQTKGGLNLKVRQVFLLRILLAEIKRLRKEQNEHKDETG